MQSRIAATIHRQLIWKSQSRRLASAVIPTGRPADPATHSGDPDGIDAEAAIKAAYAEKREIVRKVNKQLDPYVPPNPPHPPTPRLEHTEVPRQPVHPSNQVQKRRTTTSTKNTNTNTLQNVSCTGFIPEDRESKTIGEPVREQEEEDKEYFKHHKASPLSEIEMVDTRKPAMHGTVDAEVDRMADAYYRGEEMVLWRPEQLDTAEEALMRATRIWKESAARGIPDSPHGRVLRVLRGEDW